MAVFYEHVDEFKAREGSETIDHVSSWEFQGRTCIMQLLNPNN
jgi:hypothetical protein